MTLTKDRLIDIIKAKAQSNFSAQDSKKVVETLLELMKGKLEEGEDVKISGFGKWTVKEKKSRPGRNPHTGEKIEITARRVVTFHPSDKMRDAVNKAELDDSLTQQGSASDDDDDE